MGQRLGDTQREAEIGQQKQTENLRPRDTERDRQEERTRDRDRSGERRPKEK